MKQKNHKSGATQGEVDALDTKRDLEEEEEEDEEEDVETEAKEPTESAEASDTSTGPDDALGVYLRQMGAIPLLNRREELKLAQLLELKRRKFRRAVLFNWSVLDRVIEVFSRVKAGTLNLDPLIDVVGSLGLTRDNILAKLPHNLRTLRHLQRESTNDFKLVQRASRAASKLRRRRNFYRKLRKAVALAEELSPRTEMLEHWGEQLVEQTGRAERLIASIERRGCSRARREERDRAVKELRDLMLEMRNLPEDQVAIAHVLKKRRRAYQLSRTDLASANLRLVVSIAKRYRNRGLAFADLIQEGNRGLMRAVDKYEHRLGFKFGTYATWWIRQGITRALADHARTVRVPCHQIGILAAIERVRGELTARNAKEPTIEEIAKELGVPAEETKLLRTVGRHPVSLHEPMGGDGERALEDFLGDVAAGNPGQNVDQHLLRERIGEVLRSLAPREREVIELRFGLKDGHPRTLDEVAKMYGITRERIRQIEARGLIKLRQPLRSDRLIGFADL